MTTSPSIGVHLIQNILSVTVFYYIIKWRVYTCLHSVYLFSKAVEVDIFNTIRFAYQFF